MQHLCEIIKTFEKLIDSGVIRFYGLLNFSLKGIEEVRTYARKYDTVAVQNHFSLLHRDGERDVIPYVKRENLLYMAYILLEKGQLARNSILMGIERKYGRQPSR
jgi:diketogulonate reductase-like aldo/keto reductase